MPTISMFYGILIRMFYIDIEKHKLVVAWIEIHKDDLLADWNLAVNGQVPFKIKGLES